MIPREALAIVWAQWRSVANQHGRSRRGRFPITGIFALVWYGLWVFIAVAVGVTVSQPDSIDLLRRTGATSLLLQFVYWQMVPIMMVSTGVSLDLSRLMVYPIPHVQLFTIEVLLRITTSIEMLLLSAGIGVGILLNPRLPWTGAVAVGIFAAFNLFVSAGLKDLLGRLLARKGIREAMVFFLVLVAALPQVLLIGGAPEQSPPWLQWIVSSGLPWGATYALAAGEANVLTGSVLMLWTLAAWLFGRTQFERTLRFDEAEATAKGRSSGRKHEFLDVALRFATSVFKDPMAALVDKEIRFLSRSPRFRLLFLMGFSFGLLIWLPMTIRRDPESFLRTNYLTMVSAYALMLLGEVCVWNNLGLDRGAAQGYFTMPISITTVLRSKNVAAVFFIVLELMIVTVLCTLLRMPVTLAAVAEAFCVTLVFATFLLSLGNLISVRYPRGVDPTQSWRTGTVGRAQAYLLLLYPAAAAPIALAFGAQYAFDSSAALYGVLLLDFTIGLVVYAIALESSAKTAEANKESIVLALSRGEGPVGG